MVNNNIYQHEGSWFIHNDWYPGSLPPNVKLDEHAYPESAFSFSSFHSELAQGFTLGYASGNYAFGNFIVGKSGKVTIGKFAILNATNIFCSLSITIGDHCMFGWGSVITDSWINEKTSDPAIRKELLRCIASSPKRYLEYNTFAQPVVIEDNVWVGFDAVVLPGVTIGRGAVIGCKTVISEDVPAYAVVAGNPARIIRFLEPSDTPEARQEALKKFLH
jgi:acetyltransferase-like isoleucine patch superfamily enzyme